MHTILEALREIVSARWVGARAELYGSRSTGLALSSSDMDVVLLDISCPPAGVGTALKHLSEDLGKLPWVKKQHLVLSARIPVLKLHSRSGVPVDITISASLQHTGLQARDLLLSYLADSPQLAPLVAPAPAPAAPAPRAPTPMDEGEDGLPLSEKQKARRAQEALAEQHAYELYSPAASREGSPSIQRRNLRRRTPVTGSGLGSAGPQLPISRFPGLST